MSLADETEDSKKIQEVKDARDKATLDMTIRGRLYRIDLVRMEQVLINKMPHSQDSPDEAHGRRRDVSCRHLVSSHAMDVATGFPNSVQRCYTLTLASPYGLLGVNRQ